MCFTIIKSQDPEGFLLGEQSKNWVQKLVDETKRQTPTKRSIPKYLMDLNCLITAGALSFIGHNTGIEAQFCVQMDMDSVWHYHGD